MVSCECNSYIKTSPTLEVSLCSLCTYYNLETSLIARHIVDVQGVLFPSDAKASSGASSLLVDPLSSSTLDIGLAATHLKGPVTTGSQLRPMCWGINYLGAGNSNA